MSKLLTINKKLIVDELITISIFSIPIFLSWHNGIPEFRAYIAKLPINNFDITCIALYTTIGLFIILLPIFFYSKRKSISFLTKFALNCISLLISTLRLFCSATFIAALISISNLEYPFPSGLILFFYAIVSFIATCCASDFQETIEIKYCKALRDDNPIKYS